MMSPKDQLALLMRGTAQVISEKELLAKLERGKPLRAKLGVDPTSPDLHLGHSVALEKLRQFQELGHQAVLIIGDFTAQIGDPSGRSKTRPQLTRDDVLANAKTYTDQAFHILDRDKTEIVFNGEWFHAMTFADVIRLNARVTMQQMLQREDFKNRLASEQEVRLHEIQYPIVQGWDSVVVRSDVELGGTDQLFNILVGRDLQKAEGQEPQVVMTMPLLEGLDGVQKMSKSLGNYVGVTEAPTEMFGKLMSISDDLMARYYLLLLGEELDPAGHPMEAKKALAERIAARYHTPEAAVAARENWEALFSKRDLDAADLPEFALGDRRDVQGVVAAAFELIGEPKSGGDVKRLIAQGSIQLDGEKLTDPKAEPAWAAGQVLKLNKKRAVRVAG
ncbi:MAG: tyrosine--tRNA ligase [Verrucomicrobiae bacterium]|nr:tyrosine--tRNA ligase [Verrucomicrobiae bacterium]MCP5538783.1 tyrosine--tRNA ligase [Akkermansiaceae bacterium]